MERKPLTDTIRNAVKGIREDVPHTTQRMAYERTLTIVGITAIIIVSLVAITVLVLQAL